MARGVNISGVTNAGFNLASILDEKRREREALRASQIQSFTSTAGTLIGAATPIGPVAGAGLGNLAGNVIAPTPGGGGRGLQMLAQGLAGQQGKPLSPEGKFNLDVKKGFASPEDRRGGPAPTLYDVTAGGKLLDEGNALTFDEAKAFRDKYQEEHPKAATPRIRRFDTLKGETSEGSFRTTVFNPDTKQNEIRLYDKAGENFKVLGQAPPKGGGAPTPSKLVGGIFKKYLEDPNYEPDERDRAVVQAWRTANPINQLLFSEGVGDNPLISKIREAAAADISPKAAEEPGMVDKFLGLFGAGKTAEAATPGAPADPAQQQAQADIPKPTTRAEYDKLPAGAEFIDIDGKRKIKK